MSKIDIKLLKKLRELTNVPIKDCKEALIAAESDIDKAQEHLRKAGAIKSAKKADRDTNEGIVKIREVDGKLLAVKLACETDFVAKNEKFFEFADKFLDVLGNIDIDEISSYDKLSDSDKSKFNDVLAETVSVVGENVKVADVFKKNIDQLFIYEHTGNKVAGLVIYKSENPKSEEIAKEIALQSVAMDPEYTTIDDIPSELKDKTYKEFKEEVVASGKPENIAENIVQGKMNKHFSSMVLLEQPWIRDDSKKLKSIIPNDFELLEVIRYSI